MQTKYPNLYNVIKYSQFIIVRLHKTYNYNFNIGNSPFKTLIYQYNINKLEKLFFYLIEEITDLILESIKEACAIKEIHYSEEDVKKDLVASNSYLFIDNGISYSENETIVELIYHFYRNCEIEMSRDSFFWPIVELMYKPNLNKERYEIYKMANECYEYKLNELMNYAISIDKKH